MSDTAKVVLAVVVVVVVVAVVASLFRSARRRRELETRRFEAGELRARIEQHSPSPQQAATRAGAPGPVAPSGIEVVDATDTTLPSSGEGTREAADTMAAEPLQAEQQQEQGAESPRSASTEAGVPAAATASAPFLQDDDEPDLADAENPFATPGVGGHPEDAAVGTRNGDQTRDESRDDVSTDDLTTPDGTTHDGTTPDALTTQDDTTTPDDTPSSTPDTTTSESSWEGSSATGAAAAAGSGAAAGWAARSDDDDDRTDAKPTDDSLASDADSSTSTAETTTAEGGSQGEPVDETQAHESTSSTSHADEGPVEPEYDDHGLLLRGETEERVSVPALEDREDYVTQGGTPDDDPGDHRGQPWATTTGTPPPETDTDARTGAEEGQATEGALGSRMDLSTETEIDGGAGDQPSGASTDGPTDGPSEAPQASQRAGRRVSSFEEVVDGGFGIGSAAPLEGGVQPLGHDVKATRDGSTFLVPGDEGYDDVEPDVWFYNEESARRAGFRKRGE